MTAFARLRNKVGGLWALGDFLRWWVDELRATLASLLEALRIRGSTRLVLYIEGERLTVRQIQRSESQELGTLARDAEGRWATTLSSGDSTQERPPLAGSAMTAVLPTGDVLVKELVLPAAAEKSLDRVLAIQAVREFPLAASQLYLDHRVIRRMRVTKQIVVHLRAAKRAQIDELSLWAQSVGGRLDRVSYQTTGGEVSGNFLPHTSWRAIARFSNTERRLVAAAMSLLLATAAITGVQWWIERHRVNAELAKVSVGAQQVRVMWKDIETQSAPAADLVQLMGVPDAATVLGGLPESLPLDTWASQIEIRAARTTAATVNLSAFAPAASRLVDELARNSHFKRVHLIYAASDSFSNRGDRVQLSAEWIVPATTPLMPKTPQSMQGVLP